MFNSSAHVRTISMPYLHCVNLYTLPPQMTPTTKPGNPTSGSALDGHQRIVSRRHINARATPRSCASTAVCCHPCMTDTSICVYRYECTQHIVVTSCTVTPHTHSPARSWRRPSGASGNFPPTTCRGGRRRDLCLPLCCTGIERLMPYRHGWHTVCIYTITPRPFACLCASIPHHRHTHR